MQLAYARTMDKTEDRESPRRVRRRAQLEQLISEVGDAAQVARTSGTPSSHISAIRNASRGLGDKLAAKLEEAFGKPPGWFDKHVTAGNEVEPIDLDAHPDLVSIRKVNLRLSAGVNGYAVEPMSEADGDPIFFRGNWLQLRGYKPYHLLALKVTGHSMEPTLYPNDMVVINTGETEPKDGKVFAVNYEGEAVIKRMVRDSSTWWLASDHPDQRRFPRKECADGSCIIIGRVVHRQSEEI
ncbi:MAG: S24 family peptidase [Comamonadaceae bacterium]|nr:MAG: S24 family peptidase [Comamonadaceae bacterium]